MGWFDDVVKTIGDGATTVFNTALKPAAEVVFKTEIELLKPVVKSFEPFSTIVGQQWQEQQKLVVGTVLNVVGNAITVADTATGAVDKGLANYLGIAPGVELGLLVQQAQLQAAETLHQIAVKDESVDKVTELARLAILNAVKEKVEEGKKALEVVDKMVPGDLGIVDVVQHVVAVQK